MGGSKFCGGEEFQLLQEAGANFFEQKTWDFSTILSKLGSPKPGGKSLNLTKKGFYRTHLGCSFDHENIKEGTCANKCLYTWYFKIQESVDWRNVILYIVSFSSNEPFKFRKISKGFSSSGAFSEVDDWATAAGDRRGWLWSGVGNFPLQKSENPLLVTCVTCRCSLFGVKSFIKTMANG